jgi:hypothetical protein
MSSVPVGQVKVCWAWLVTEKARARVSEQNTDFIRFALQKFFGIGEFATKYG